MARPLALHLLLLTAASLAACSSSSGPADTGPQLDGSVADASFGDGGFTCQNPTSSACDQCFESCGGIDEVYLCTTEFVACYCSTCSAGASSESSTQLASCALGCVIPPADASSQKDTLCSAARQRMMACAASCNSACLAADSGADSGSSSPTDSGPGLDSGSASLDAGSCGFDGGSPVCSTLSPPCTPVALTQSTAPVPTFAGGTIAAGTYVLASATVYTAGTCAGSLPFPEMSLTYAFTGSGSGNIQGATRVQSGAATQDETGSGTYSISGSTLSLDETCNPNGVTLSSFPFTATATGFTYDSTKAGGGVLHEADGGFCGDLVLVLTKM